MVSISNQSDIFDQNLPLIGPIVCLLATLSWSFGSTWARFVEKPANPMMFTSMQMLSGGFVLSIIAAISGDYKRFQLSSMTFRTWTAFAYLVIFGSFIAYNAYIWLLHNADLAMVSTYTYVNPVVAVFLGWAIGGETIHPMYLGSAFVILLAVIIISKMKEWTPNNQKQAK